jgi:hypothetical protein
MLARSQFRTCHSPNQRTQLSQGWEGKIKKAPKGAFLLDINIVMISNIKFSNLFPVKHTSPVGNPDGYYTPKIATPVVPIKSCTNLKTYGSCQ